MFTLLLVGWFVVTVGSMLTIMLVIVTNPYTQIEGTYKPVCKRIMLQCTGNTTLYTSYHTKALCEGEVIHVEKPVKYQLNHWNHYLQHETFYLNAGTRIETTHKVFQLYEYQKWLKYKRSKLTTSIDKDGYYVIVSEVPYMKYTIRKSTYCEKTVEYVCGDTPSRWIPVSEYHYIETIGKDYLQCFE